MEHKIKLVASIIAILLMIVLLRCTGCEFANELTFIGTMTLAAVTVYQNWILREQNEKLRIDARLNVNRPYLEIDAIFFTDSDWIILGSLGDDPLDFTLENGIWSQTSTNLPPQALFIHYKTGNGNLIELEVKRESIFTRE